MKRHTFKAAAGMFLLIGFLLIGIALDIVWAMDGRQGPGGPPMPLPPEAGSNVAGIHGGPLPHVWGRLSSLGLDEQQKEAIKEIRSREAKDHIKKMADVRIAEIELKDILDKDTVDMNAVEAKLKRISSLMTDIRLSGIQAIEAVKTKLTPAQRKKFKEISEMRPITGGIPHEGMKIPPPMTEHRQHP
ncbi:MAG: periplasmic protein [Syntrophorhabdus sp. PtaU1.Bin058]|nr:MAG: periplasmic protein [Syntrophorhabdus sp. PtaU1.Bin058]